MTLGQETRFGRVTAFTLLGAVGIVAALYSLVTPLWEAPDSVGHFQYARHLATGHGLPIQRVGELGEAHQPPLYYLIAALAMMPIDLDAAAGAFTPNRHFVWAAQGGTDVNISVHTAAETFPFRGQALAVHLARGVSVLSAVLTVALTLALGWEVFPHQRLVGLFGAALVGLTPQFLFISGAVNNDNLLILAATGAWWQTVRALKRPEQARQWVYVGLWAMVAILAKVSGPVILAVAELTLVSCATQRRSRRLFFTGSLALGLVVLVGAGWWLARNQVLYGDPLGWAMYWKVFHVDLRETPLEWTDVGQFFSVQFRSFWGVFGWMNLWPPSWFYIFPATVGLLGLIGLGVFAMRGRFSQLVGSQKAAVAVLGLAIVVQEVFLMALATRCNPSCYQGRYLFPVIAPLMILISLGIISLLPGRLAIPTVLVIVLVLLGAAAYVPFGVIQPAYQLASLH